MKLYPLKFKPILKPTIWGGDKICAFKGITPKQKGIGESWEISSVDDDVSVVANGELTNKSLEEVISIYKEQLVGANNYKTFGTTFPLLIKFIDASDNLSIQVHPDDKLAKERHNTFGKTEMWYVVNAAPEAFLYAGFSKEILPNFYATSVANNTFVDCLDKHNVKAGDVFFLPAGRVHAIGAGTFVAEIQQTSNITYRIHDYNRKDASGKSRELHTDLAKDAIDFKIYQNHKNSYTHKENEAVELESCEYFTTNLLELTETITRDYSSIDSFVTYICMSGACLVKDNRGNELAAKQGETILIPADTTSIVIIPQIKTLLLETYI